MNSKNTLNILDAVKCLERDQLVVVPTETVYGLAANALSRVAINNIFIAKGRPQDNPLIIHLANPNDIFRYTKNTPDYLNKLIEKFCPGPLSFVLEKNELIPDITTAGLKTAAFRIPNNKLFLSLIKQFGYPLAAPSANLSSRPSATNFKDAMDEFYDSKLVCGGLDGGVSEIGIESTVIKCEQNKITILRYGNITANQISDTVNIEISLSNKNQKAESPGTKYLHYAPDVDIFLVKNFKNYDPDTTILAEYDSDQNTPIDEKNLYDLFRLAEKEKKNLAILDTEKLSSNKALYDRISRASQK